MIIELDRMSVLYPDIAGWYPMAAPFGNKSITSSYSSTSQDGLIGGVLGVVHAGVRSWRLHAGADKLLVSGAAGAGAIALRVWGCSALRRGSFGA
jgi:hypothetical protein